MEAPLISIVTPSFNQAPFLEKTILSVLNQSYSKIEYIVMDGGSDDGSRQIIEKYNDRIAFWQSEKDAGQTNAINNGFSHAHGQIYAWINSDDTYEPETFARVARYFQTHPEVGLVYGDCNFIDQNDRLIGKFNARQTDYRRLRRGYVHIPQQAAFWRADLWKRLGPLDESIYFAMDYDLWLRIAKVAPIRYEPQLWANFRLHGGAKTITEDDRCWPDMLKIHYRNGGSVLSFIVAKYWLRKFVAPFLRKKRQKMMRLPPSGKHV